VAHSDAAVMLLAGMPAGAPEAIDARAARLSFRPLNDAPVCCARGAPIDVRQKLGLDRLKTFRFDGGPVIDGLAPSGVIERLADVPHCAALEGEGVRGTGCGIRRVSLEHQLREDVFLLEGCALFPLEVIGGVLTPSERIPDAQLVEGTPTLWDEARARFAIRFGDAAAGIVDAAASDLQTRRSRSIHLKMIR
jgi:hypothetical protein